MQNKEGGKISTNSSSEGRSCLVVIDLMGLIKDSLRYGPTAHSKNSKMPLFKRYYDILPVDDSNRSRMAPKFLF